MACGKYVPISDGVGCWGYGDRALGKEISS